MGQTRLQGSKVVIATDHPAEQALLRLFCARRRLVAFELSPGAGAAAFGAAQADLLLIDDPGAQQCASLVAGVKKAAPGTVVVLLSDLTERQLRATRPDLGGADAVLARLANLAAFDELLRSLRVEDQKPPSRKRVLVVDDDEDILRFCRKALEKAGCAVTCVSDAEQFLARPTHEQFDIVLLDVMMPGVDGLELCLVLRSHHGSDVRICMITASRDEQSVRIASTFGADGFLAKPLQESDLLRMVMEPSATRTAAAPPGPAQAVPAPVNPSPARIEPSRILVVDDDDDVLEYCRKQFMRAGAIVDTARDPASLREVLARGAVYDVLLFDIFLPETDGIELLRRCVADDPRHICARFYVMSAEDEAGLRIAAQRSGADGYLTKPLDSLQLRNLLKPAEEPAALEG